MITFKQAFIFIVMSIVSLSCLIYADGFKINSAEAMFNKSSLSINAEFDLQLSDPIKEALHNGVGIELKTILDLSVNRAYLWDKRIARWSFIQQIDYHSLTNRYILRLPQKNEQQSFSSLTDLLNVVANFNFQSDISSDTMPTNKNGYTLQLNIALNNAALPTPLRALSYVLPAWKLRSNIHKWLVAG